MDVNVYKSENVLQIANIHSLKEFDTKAFC